MKKVVIVFSSLFVSACASPEVVKKQQIGDTSLSCTELMLAIEEAKRFEEDAREERTVTGTNVAAALFWWPGLAATYINTDDAIDAATDRQEYLNGLFEKKNCSTNVLQSSDVDKVSDELKKLKQMHSDNLITDEEYEAARKKVLGLDT